MNLDFSVLTDDQLIDLIGGACQEAVARGSATEAAARDVMLSARERADIAASAAAKEAERLRQDEARRVAEEAAARVRVKATQAAVTETEQKERTAWAKRKGIAQAIAAIGWDVKGDQIVVWLSASKEKRVFFQQAKYDGHTYATLYVTGNARNAPGTVDVSGIHKDNKQVREEIPAILRAIARDWNTLKVDLPAALAWDGDAIPLVVETPETARPA